MHRAFRIISLIVLSAYIVGCGGDSVNDTSSTPAPDAAKAAAVKMPPPPNMSPKKK